MIHNKLYMHNLREYTYVPQGSGIVYITITRDACSSATRRRSGPAAPRSAVSYCSATTSRESGENGARGSSECGPGAAGDVRVECESECMGRDISQTRQDDLHSTPVEAGAVHLHVNRVSNLFRRRVESALERFVQGYPRSRANPRTSVVQIMRYGSTTVDISIFGGGGYFIVAPRGRPTLARGRPTPRMAVVSVWSLEEDTLKANFT